MAHCATVMADGSLCHCNGMYISPTLLLLLLLSSSAYSLLFYSTLNISTNPHFLYIIKMQLSYLVFLSTLLGEALAANSKLNQYASISDWYVALRYIITYILIVL
jgi:hypothetical protein